MLGEIHNREGERLDYTFQPGADDNRCVVVIGHGVTGNKDRPFSCALADGLANAGIASIRLSFSGNGNSAGAFADSTISKEIDDLFAVIDRLVEVLGDVVVGYAGHSMGGAVGVMATGRDQRISFLISLAGMVRTAQFAQRKFGDLVPGKGLMWDKPECPLSQKYMDDMAHHGDLLSYGPEIEVPWLFVHGTADDVVPIVDSRDMYGCAQEPKELCEIEGADHVFSGETMSVMVNKVTGWTVALIASNGRKKR